MRVPRFRFTIRHLISLIVLEAVVLALIRTPAWPFILAFGLILPGFTIDRARDGSGILGAMLAGMIGFAGTGMVFYALDWWLSYPESNFNPPFAFFYFLALMGLIWGLSVGLWARLIVSITQQRTRAEPLQAESCGPIYWRSLDDLHEMTH